MMKIFNQDAYSEIEEIVNNALQHTTKKGIKGHIDSLKSAAEGQNKRVMNKIFELCAMLECCCNQSMYAQRQRYHDFVIADLFVLKGMIVAEDGDDQ